MQLLITSKTRAAFDTKVNSVLLDGATIVPGTMTIGMVAFQKANGDAYLQSRYTAVVELTGEQSEACRVVIAERDARAGEPAVCGCVSAAPGDYDGGCETCDQTLEDAA